MQMLDGACMALVVNRVGMKEKADIYIAGCLPQYHNIMHKLTVLIVIKPWYVATL